VLMGKEGKTALSLWSSCHARTGRQPHTVQIHNPYPGQHLIPALSPPGWNQNRHFRWSTAMLR